MKTKILIAPNVFKHSLSAIEVANVVKSALDSLNLNLSTEIAPIADGGDGTIDILNFYFKKSKFIECSAHDPIGRNIKSKWLLLDNATGVIELAKASGISLLKEDELNPMWANTFGTGELILSALDKGCKKIIIALGGSATVDAGLGLLQAFGVKILDSKKHLIKTGGGFLLPIHEIDFSSLDKRIKGIKIQVLCDVKIPLIGERGTVNKFSVQKGAKEGEKIILENGMKHYSEIVKKITNNNYEDEAMVGAAGGVAFSLKALLGAELFPGFLYIAKLILLEEKIKEADLIITGEGSLDAQTLMGKAVIELAKLAKKYKKKVIAFCGTYDKGINWEANGIDHVIQIAPEDLSLTEAIENTAKLLQSAVKNNPELFTNN